MMSYLWILLLGSLLAAHAKAQDDVTPTVEPETDIGEHEDGEAVTVTEELSHTESEPEPTANPDVETAQPVTPADVSTEPEATDVPEGDEEKSVTPTIGKTEPVTPVADAETEALATAQAADSEDNTPEAAQPTVNAEKEPTTKVGTTPVQESGLDDLIHTIGLKVNTGEAPTDPANEESSTDEVTTIFEERVTTNPGFNLGDAVEKMSVPDQKSDDPEFTLEDAVEKMSVPDQKSDVLKLEDALEEGNGILSPSGGKSRSVPAVGASGSGDHQPQKSSSSSLAGILSAIVVSAVGAVAGYFTYQQKKLCFKNRQEADPEAAHKADAAEAQSDPQVLSNLLNSS